MYHLVHEMSSHRNRPLYSVAMTVPPVSKPRFEPSRMAVNHELRSYALAHRDHVAFLDMMSTSPWLLWRTAKREPAAPPYGATTMTFVWVRVDTTRRAVCYSKLSWNSIREARLQIQSCLSSATYTVMILTRLFLVYTELICTIILFLKLKYIC